MGRGDSVGRQRDGRLGSATHVLETLNQGKRELREEEVGTGQ